MRNRRKVISILIICGLPTLLSASSWFNFFTDFGEDETISHDMVSPIVNREVEASVVAHNWPFIVDNIYCEAWSYHRHKNWEFMDHLVKLLSEGGGDKGSFQEAMELVLKSSNKKDSALLQYSLSLRAHSPLCELHRTLARSHTLLQPEKLSAAEAFYVIPGEQDFIGVTVEELLKLLDMAVDQSGKTEEELLLPDEVARNADGNRKDSPLIIVYANMGSDAFGKLYQVLVEKQARFVVRHRGNVLYEENGGASTALQGYGVRLDIRNVEYRVFDDRSSSLDGNEASLLNSSSLESLTNHTLAGIKLSELDMSAEEKLKLQSELWKLHEAQQIHSQLVPPKWQRRKLSLQAATVISQSQSDVLFTLQDVSQNLPSVASTLVHVPVPEDLVELVDLMEPIMRQTNGVALTINGRRVPVGRPSFNVFDLLKMMREEQELLDGMLSKLSPFLPFKGIQQVQKVWSLGEGHFLGTEGQDSGDYDENEDDPGFSGTVRRIDVGRKWKGAVLYVNDVEKDQMYMNWPRSVQQAIMAMQFGSPPTVRRNIFTVLSVLDPMEGKTAEHAGLGLGSQLMQASYPVRLGYLIVNAKDLKQCKAWIRDNGISDPDQPCPTDQVFDTKVTNIDQLQKIPASTHAIHRLIAKMNEEYSGQPLLPSFADYFLQRIDTFTSDDGSLTMGDMVRTFGEIMQQLDGMNPNSAIKFAIDALNDVDNVGKSTYGKALRFALNRAVTPGMGFLNGRQISIDNDPGKVFMEEQNHIFGLIMKGKITDAKPKSIYGSLLAGDGVFPRLHPLLNEVDDAHIDLDHGLSSDALLIPKNVVVGVGDVPDAVFVVEAVVNMKSKDDVGFVANFISIMDACPNTLQDGSSTANVLIGYRILCAPSDSTPALCSILSNAGLVGVDRTKLIVSEDGILEKSTNDILDLITDLDDEVRETISSFSYANSWARDKTMPITNFVSVNGKSYAPEEGTLSEEDIELLLSMEISRSKATTKMLSDHLVFAKSEKNFFDAIAKTSIFLARQFSKSEKGKGKRMDMVNEAIELEKAEKLDANPFRFSWNMDNFEELKIQVSVVLDPATEDAQRVAPFLIAFRDVLKLPLQMILVPKALTGDDKSVPITSYYRFVADPNAMPDVNPPKASFSNLPTNHILTLRMDVPESWNVQQTSSIQDTDNLRCDIKMGCGDDAHDGTTDPSIMTHDKRQITRVEYGLKNLLIFGQCYDATQKSPPNGLQLTLSREKNKGVQLQAAAEVSPDGTLQVSYPSFSEDTHYSDTLVMKTVGYWQLRANPGIWQLQIASGSRGADIFDMVDGSIENGRMKISKKQVNNATKTIYVKDFTANEDARVLMVKRRPGWEKASLFYEDKRSTKSNDGEVIHVFSLATGHLYERFLKIMMLSVTKRTSMKVKFWLFENFLSPTFKASAEAMATRIGCEVEFVTYKWPEFLRGQSEKQRIIWGYKILFLDVLFPLNVKKIIYVDADQVVRGDLKELWEMDLKGAPYGYTPMCSSRESTLGFQFWNSGFWETHLRGKPYHISALYVVDLEKFRKDLVGDNLRSTYQQLSADPHSLANLDQDLPNYAQHQVPIFSLPQEWLWCESWCSDESKAAAKTIDLCNNPLHKEPKVSMAKRIISGDLFQESWIELDAEVETYEKEYFESQSTK